MVVEFFPNRYESDEEFWTKFQNLMKGLGIKTKITLKHIALGYKIDDKKNYFALNILLTVVGFSIYRYKSYYISEQKIKYINVYRIFVNEYIKRIKENKTLQKCTFLMKVKNCILRPCKVNYLVLRSFFCQN